jgi:nitrogen-specific signal transduction histidine kinase
MPKVDYLSALPVPVIVVDQAGEPVLANPAAELLLNIAEHVLCEKGWGAVLPPDSQLADIMHEARQSGADFAAYDVDLALLFGRRITVDVLVSPMADAPGWSVLAFQRRAAATIVNRQRGRSALPKCSRTRSRTHCPVFAAQRNCSRSMRAVSLRTSSLPRSIVSAN